MRPKRFGLVATHARSGRAWVSLHDTMSEALLVAECYRAAPGRPQGFGVVIRDLWRWPTYIQAIQNQEVVFATGEGRRSA